MGDGTSLRSEEMMDAKKRELISLLPRLQRFCLGLTGSRERADDLAQATCERALARLDQWKAGTRMDSWLFTVAKSVWINDWHRRQTRGVEVPLDQVGGRHASDGVAAAEQNLLLKRVMEKLVHLPDEQRQVLLLVCVEGFSYAEAAKILDIRIGTLMSRLARARRKIQHLAMADAGTGRVATIGE